MVSICSLFHISVERGRQFSESLAINPMQDSHDMAEIFLWGTNRENLHADSSPIRHFDFDDIGFGSRREKIRGRYIRDRRAMRHVPFLALVVIQTLGRLQRYAHPVRKIELGSDQQPFEGRPRRNP
jgi:hypothetical protein